MKTFLKPLLAALCLLALSAPAMAQYQTRAYAPEDLRTLSYDDQVRVIRQEYLEQSGGRRIAGDQLRFYIDQVNRSNWRFSDIKRDIAQSLGGVSPPGGGWGETVRCESNDNRNRTCPTPWRGYSRLSRQLSRTRCIEGQNWASRDGEVAVWGGCRAEFVSGGEPGYGGGSQVVSCHSKDNDARRCPTPWRGRSRLVRQVSRTTCVEGRNWNSQDGLITVWKGCRAEFAPAGGGPGHGNGYTVTCASRNGRYATCNWPPGQGLPRLIRQLSPQACVQGHTWGMAGTNRIWVNGGCRALFGN